MHNTTDYIPPKVWTWDQESGGKFASINRPVAGATHAKDLPVGRHPLQLYSLATPNGVKVTVMLEELLALGHVGAKQALESLPASKAQSGKQEQVYKEAPSPMTALEACDKGCVVYYKSRWVCASMAETRAAPYEGLGTMCKGP